MPAHRENHLSDPVSPFQPSFNKKPAATTKRTAARNGTAKTDQAFINKVTNASAADIFWSETARKDNPDASMAKTTLMSNESVKLKKAVEAFKTQGQRRKKFKEQFSDFCDETSFTPLTRIYKASSWKRKVGWTILLLAMLSWLSVQCYWLLVKYFDYPMEVKVDILAAKELSFPSVSICNLNPVRKQFYEKNEDMEEMRHFGDMTEQDDKLYDYVYQNADKFFSGQTSATNSPGTLTANSLATNAAGTPAANPSTTTAAGTPAANPSTTTAAGTPAPNPSTTTAAGTPAANPSTTTAAGTPAPNPSTTTAAGTPAPNPSTTTAAGTPAPNPSTTTAAGTPAPNPSTTTAAGTPAPNPSTTTAGSGPPPPGRRKKRSAHDDIDIDPNIRVSSDDADPDDEDGASVSQEGAEGVWWPGSEEGEPVGRVRRQAGGGSSGSEEHERKMEMMKSFSFNKWDALNDNENVSYYTARSSDFQATMSYATNAAKMDPVTLKSSGHLLKDMLINCKYNGWPCSPNNFTYFHSHKYGNCYTINSHDSPKELTTKYAGPEYGLTVELFIQQDEYVPSLAAEAGVRVLIHPKGKYPFPEDEGLSISPSHSSSVSIREVRISRLTPPHGQCDETPNIVDLYAATHNTTYSKLSCLKSCYQTIALSRCNCSLPIYIVSDKKTVCNMTDSTVDVCVSKLCYNYPEDFAACDKACPQPCTEVAYDMMVSAAAWPSNNYEHILIRSLQQSSALLVDREGSDDDFVKLNVFFRDLLYENIEQQKGYESQNLISDIGGQLGLWLGLSAITIGELCGLILSVFRSLTSGNKPEDVNGSTPVKPISKDLGRNANDLMLSDVKSAGFV